MVYQYVRLDRNLTVKRLPEKLQDSSMLRFVAWEVDPDSSAQCVFNIIEGPTSKAIIYFNRERKTFGVNTVVTVEKAKNW